MYFVCTFIYIVNRIVYREIYTAGKKITLPPAVTAWTNLTSVIFIIHHYHQGVRTEYLRNEYLHIYHQQYHHYHHLSIYLNQSSIFHLAWSFLTSLMPIVDPVWWGQLSYTAPPSPVPRTETSTKTSTFFLMTFLLLYCNHPPQSHLPSQVLVLFL